MARVIKTQKNRNVCIRLNSDINGLHPVAEIVLVPGGPRRAYLWIGAGRGTSTYTVSGEKALRALARAILKEVGCV